MPDRLPERVLPPVPSIASVRQTPTESQVRAAFLAQFDAWARERVPYVWDGKMPETGLDCSGAVTVAGAALGIFRLSAPLQKNAENLYRDLKRIDPDDAKPGDLVFYGKPDHVTHVMVWVGDGRVVGACGGSRECISPEIAQRIGACVKYREIGHYRLDVVGFGRLPIPG